MARDWVRASCSVLCVAPSVLLLALACLALLASGAVAAPPPNDDFGDATPIRVGATVKGTVNGATMQRGEPLRSRSRAVRSVWYRLQVEHKLTVRLSTCTPTFDSVLAVYGGRALRSLRVIDYNDNGCGRSGGGSRVTFTARAGRTYRIAVAVLGSDQPGNFPLRATSVRTPANDDFSDAVPIRLGSTVSGTTRDATREFGEPVVGPFGTRSVWFSIKVAAARTVRLDACNGSTPNIGVYTGGRVDRLTPVPTVRHCLVQFAARPRVTYRVELETNFGNHLSGRFRLTARTARPPANDDLAAAIPITLGTTTSGTTRDASVEPFEPFSSPFTVWFRLTLTETTSFTLDACADKVELWVYTGAQMDELTRSDSYWSDAYGWGSCALGGTLPPGVYSIQVGRRSEGDFTLRADVAPRP
jgi:hypothetical protein